MNLHILFLLFYVIDLFVSAPIISNDPTEDGKRSEYKKIKYILELY